MSGPRVAVCAATYGRPDGLRLLLQALALLRFRHGIEADVTVVIVDNNPHGDAHREIDAVLPGYPWPLIYVWEPRPGISFARNSALDAARGSDFTAFLDDDEEPEPEWLDQLLAVQEWTGADVVAGPVFPRYMAAAPKWIVDGRFFEPRDQENGAEIAEAWSNNVLFRTSVVSESGLRFEEALALSGGEDSLFFTRMRRMGCSIHWARHAVVYEDVPGTRTTAGWLLRRWYRTGITDALVHTDGMARLRGRMVNVGRGGVRLLAGSALLLAAAPLGLLRPHVVMARCYTVCRGLGIIAHVFDRTYSPYRR